MYHNTTKETGKTLQKFTQKAANQDETILQICKAFKRPFSAKDVFNAYPNNRTPMTSIRRSLNTLHYRENNIEPTGEKVKGMYGRPETQYRTRTNTNT